VTDAARRVLEASGAKLEWDFQRIGVTMAERHGGNPLPTRALDSIRKNGVALKGPLTTPVESGFRSANIELRRILGLYAQVRTCKSFPGVPSHFSGVDLVVIRETTEDLYAGIEFELGAERTLALIDWLAEAGFRSIHRASGISIKPLSEPAARRIFQFAFDYARRNSRRKVTAVHKATVMKQTDGLLLRIANEVAAKNPSIEFDDRLVDSLAAQLVQRPEAYDVLVMTNLYGDIVADLAAGLIGGVGLMPGANFGEDAVVFEPAHGSAPKYAGLNRVNPMAMILSGAMMLRHLGETAAAANVERAVAEVIADGDSVTYDLKASRDDPTAVGTSEVASAVIKKLTGLNQKAEAVS
jgi:isocitrate dehydrogenase (NAD+)